jgi:hypothetical protein
MGPGEASPETPAPSVSSESRIPATVRVQENSPVQVASDRLDVGQTVLDRQYDKREKLEQHRRYPPGHENES